MPRSALLSIHARVAGTPPTVIDNPSLIQIWGPRYSTYVIAAVDLPVFTLGRMPDDAAGQERAERAAAQLHELLAGSRMKYDHAGDALGVNANSLRYGTTTGTIVLRWEGARAPEVWTVPRLTMTVEDARLELARRYLHVFGPATDISFAEWAGVAPRVAATTFKSLSPELAAVHTPLGEGWLLSADEAEARAKDGPPAPARLLPSGDTYYLLQGRDRELLLPDAQRRSELWTSRVWPGALLVDGEISGVWRRANEKVDITTWQRLTPAQTEAVEAEAVSMPLPGLVKPITVRWQ